MCGEKSPHRPSARSCTGSPPRVRGKVGVRHRRDVGYGITPACAGKSPRRTRWKASCRDHPRVCGEKGLRIPIDEDVMGSPPRVRGKGFYVHRERICIRITPACAGKSISVRESIRCDGDHPRVCGEKVSVGSSSPEMLGSPPRVRGKVDVFDASVFAARITPACAGKSTTTKCRMCPRQDHPRVCGEKSTPRWI